MSIQASESLHHLFGGTCSWDFDSWHASDDRVRGGKSQSHLEAASPSASGATHQNARFFGDLDITALGGAGFASQRTADSKSWDLSPYSGLSIKIVNGDGKKYTLILKDEILPKRPDGREQSTISWEYDFVGEQSELRISWADFKPTYRGKAKPDADPLDLTGIKLLSIMMRSFFGNQQGRFDLEVAYIAATPSNPESIASAPPPRDGSRSSTLASPQAQAGQDVTWLGWVRGWLRGVL